MLDSLLRAGTIGRALLFGAVAFFLFSIPALADCEPEAPMRDVALAATELASIDAYLTCHQYSDFAVSVREHRRRVAADLTFASATTIDDFRAFVLRYPESPLVQEALARINALNSAVSYLSYPSSMLIGTQAGQSTTEDAAQCANACTAHGTCQGYSFARGGVCTLFAGVTGRMPQGKVVSGALTEPPLASVEPSPSTAQQSDSSFMVRQGLFVSGRTLSEYSAGSGAVCQAGCAAERQCVAFVYEVSTGQCSLRASLVTSTPDPAYVSGMKASGAQSTPAPAPTFDIFNNVDLENPRNSPSDYSIMRNTSASLCEQLCAADNQCRAFTHNGDVNACILKSDYTRAVSYPGATSGEKR